MIMIHSEEIRKSKNELSICRSIIKKELRDQLSERGDIAHIHRLLNKRKPITYGTVVYTLNPNSNIWSQRVIDFVREYISTRDTLQNSDEIK